jgi:RNA polymerase sigma-70 factor (ECF subfamily)
MIPMEARALIEVLNGERARFLRMARARVETEADAEDVVQRAMMRTTEHSASFADPARVRAWFYRILRRTIVDHHRSKARDRAYEPLEEAEAYGECGPAASTPCCCALRLVGEPSSSPRAALPNTCERLCRDEMNVQAGVRAGHNSRLPQTLSNAETLHVRSPREWLRCRSAQPCSPWSFALLCPSHVTIDGAMPANAEEMTTS